MADDLIAVTGATGQVGRRVVALLAEREVPQRLVVRDAARAQAPMGAEVRQAASYGAADELQAVLEGAGILLLIPVAESQDRVEQHRSAIDAAVAANIQHIVYLSFVNASYKSTFTFARDHNATEQHVRNTGVPFTILRRSMYLDFLPQLVGADGVIRGPAGAGRVGAVARDDVAEALVTVLTAARGHEMQTFDITGAQSLSLPDVAEHMARASGKAIAFQDETVDEAYASRADLGAPEWQIDGWVSSYLAIAAGELDVVSDAVWSLTGHHPRTLEQVLESSPVALQHVR